MFAVTHGVRVLVASGQHGKHSQHVHRDGRIILHAAQNRPKPLEAQRPNPHLDKTPPGMTAMTSTARPASTGNAEAELDRLARQAQSEQRITYAEAYRRVLMANPRLYTACLEQRPRQNAGSNG